MPRYSDDERPPDDLLASAEAGRLDHDALAEWLPNAPEAIRDYEGRISDEWLPLLAAADADPGSWDDVTVHRYPDGSWDVIAFDEDGTPSVMHILDDEYMEDIFWTDMYDYIVDDLGLDVDREYE